MELIKADIRDDADILLFGDSHEGTIAQHRDGLLEAIEYLGTHKNAYGIFMGDEVEAIVVDDKRYDPALCTEPFPLLQSKAVVKAFWPVRKKILCWLWGNHPRSLYRYGNLTRDVVCKDLGIRYGTWAAKVDFGWFKFFVCHGMRGNLVSRAKDYRQRKANLEASLIAKLVGKAGDCVLMACGHFHQLISVPPADKLYLIDDGRKIKQRYLTALQRAEWIDPDRRWYGCTGSFLKSAVIGASTYAEIEGYDPVELGCLVAEVRGRKVTNLRRWVM